MGLKKKTLARDFKKYIDKSKKAVYNNNVGAPIRLPPSLIKKITALFRGQGGYLFLLLQMSITRLIIAIIKLQKRNNASQVMYIASPPSL